ncbi:hypothetical protein BDP27DRAFT_1446377 [Rhodocollybia butyracea]|uniref:Uncharacterized protein n=1 Tax=Rhodocollybia butyracea TaxID=206335 RepID=A0A9P5PZD2_9AGAR|nr:hypothetical protein BDP27DRAFT_1446377 [Rhodocollybia butyracea]
MSSHRCTSFLVLASAVLFSGIQAIAPPSALGLVFPADPVHVPSTIDIGSSGFTGGNPREYVNMFVDLNISIICPNSTSKFLIATVGCGGGSSFGGGTAHFLVDQEGTYTILWNVTYGIPFVPYEANSTTSDCNPGPFSYQSLVLNKTFTASGPSTSGANIEVTTVTSSFATVPTGQVVFLNGARKLSGMYLMSILVVVLGHFHYCDEMLSLECLYLRPTRAV